MQNIINKLDRCFLTEDQGKLVLRVTVAFLILLHGIYKIQNPGTIDFIGGLFNNYHLPAFLAYLVYVGEVLAPLMVIVGYKTRLAGRLMAITMVVAILLAHIKDIFSLTQVGGSAIELQLMLLVGSIAVAAFGAGKYSMDKK